MFGGTEGPTTDRDLVDILTADHAEVESLFADIEAVGRSPQDRRRLLDVAIAELVRHAVAEEEYLYPTAREVFSDGEALADRELGEHAEMERLMKRLESMEPEHVEFEQLLAELMATVREHVRDEERTLFPRLREACSHQQLGRLAGAAEMAKTSAPTRPHPSAPDTPPWNMLLAPGAGLIDRVRDAISSRPTSRDDLS
ncbi:hemerythrin domain-containing protein [Pilimelia columellifera]|uniref:Hemerythrin domain-containing protein n=1 Tax=Pilimelia columellifera subsp. columellifera TaxID=706583 RepID=A0ABP6A6L0_9ACTN